MVDLSSSQTVSSPGRVYPINIPLNHYKIPLNHYKIPLNHYKIPLNHYKIPLNHYKIPLNPIKSSKILPSFSKFWVQGLECPTPSNCSRMICADNFYDADGASTGFVLGRFRSVLEKSMGEMMGMFMVDI